MRALAVRDPIRTAISAPAEDLLYAVVFPSQLTVSETDSTTLMVGLVFKPTSS